MGFICVQYQYDEYSFFFCNLTNLNTGTSIMNSWSYLSLWKRRTWGSLYTIRNECLRWFMEKKDLVVFHMVDWKKGSTQILVLRRNM